MVPALYYRTICHTEIDINQETKLKATLHWNILRDHHSTNFEMGFLAVSVLSGFQFLPNLAKAISGAK